MLLFEEQVARKITKKLEVPIAQEIKSLTEELSRRKAQNGIILPMSKLVHIHSQLRRIGE